MNKTLIAIALALSINGVAKAAPSEISPTAQCMPMRPCSMEYIRYLSRDTGTWAIVKQRYQAYADRPEVMESLRKIQAQIDALHAQADANKVATQVAKQKADQNADADRRRLDAAMRADPAAFQAAIAAKNAAYQAAYQAKSAKVAPTQPAQHAAVQPMSVEWCTERGQSGTDICPTRPKATAQEQKQYYAKEAANEAKQEAAEAAYDKAHPAEAKLTAQVVQCHKDFQDPRGARPGTPAYIAYASACNQAEQALKDLQFPAAAHAVKAKAANVAAPAKDLTCQQIGGDSYCKMEAKALAQIKASVAEIQHPHSLSEHDRQCSQLLGMLDTASSNARQVIMQNLNTRGCSIPQEAEQDVAHPAYDACVAVLQQAGATDTSHCDHLYDQ